MIVAVPSVCPQLDGVEVIVDVIGVGWLTDADLTSVHPWLSVMVTEKLPAERPDAKEVVPPTGVH